MKVNVFSAASAAVTVLRVDRHVRILGGLHPARHDVDHSLSDTAKAEVWF
jgi:hypothetical protein